MSFEQQRADFNILLLDNNVDRASEIRTSLVVEGYSCFWFQDQATFSSRLKEVEPQLVVIQIDSMETSLSNFIEYLQAHHPRTRVLIVAQAANAQALIEYRNYQVDGIVVEGDHIGTRVLWQADRSCREIYFQMMNLQLLKEQRHYKDLQAKLVQEKSKVMSEISLIRSMSLDRFIEVLEREEKRDSFIDRFLEFTKLDQYFYFQFLPTARSLVLVRSSTDQSSVDLTSYMTDEELSRGKVFFERDYLESDFGEMLVSKLKITDAQVFPIYLQGALDSILVTRGFFGERLESFQGAVRVFELFTDRFMLQKKLSRVDQRDIVSDLWTKKTGVQKLVEEIERAKRLKQPISCIIVSIDHFFELQQSIGVFNLDLVIKGIAKFLLKLVRINDVLCRWTEREFLILLPHTDKKSTTLTAERIRRSIEAHSFSTTGIKVTVSSGVSEFPTLSRTGEELISSTEQAVRVVQEKGSNRICIYQPTEKFIPEFEVPSV